MGDGEVRWCGAVDEWLVGGREMEVENGSSGGVGKSPCQWIDGRGRWR